MGKKQKKREVAGHLKKQAKKQSNKIQVIIMIVLALLVIIILGVAFYKYFKGPEKQLNLGANIEKARLNENNDIVYIKLAGGINYGNITKIKFIFKDAEKEYVYETSEGASEISVPFKRSFLDLILDLILGKKRSEEKYDYEIEANEANLNNFNSIDEVSVLFEYKTGTGGAITTPSTDTTKPTLRNQTTTGGGGGGGGGGTSPAPCTPSKTCADYLEQCGVGLSDGCSNVLDCSNNCQIEIGTYCYTGEGTSYVCVNESLTCYDSDSKNYFTKGNVTINNLFAEDSCLDSKNLTEYYCYYNGSDFEARTESYECSENCQDGACTIPAGCGNNIIEAGEVCDGTDLGGQTCISQGYDEGNLACCSSCGQFDFFNCINITRTCTDSDGGIDYYTPSNVSEFEDSMAGPDCFGILPVGGVYLNVALDSCNGTVLSEKICNADNTTGTIIHDCSSEGKICQAGACVSLPCAPDKDCSYYYNLNQCGTGLSDGCSAVLDCLTCPGGKICQGGVCIKPGEFTISIATPLSVSSFYEDDSITFTQTVSGGTPPYTYSWSSSLDGIFGNSDSFSYSDLNPGMHIITLSVSDSTGETKEDSISLTIKSLDTLRVNIINPKDELHYYGNSSDLTLNFLVMVFGGKAPYSYNWSSDKDGAFGSGSVWNSESVWKNDLSINTHIITAEITDSKGSIASDSITIDIVPNGALKVDIRRPTRDTFAFGSSIQFLSSVSGGGGPYYWNRTIYNYTWTSNKDGLIGDTSSFTTNQLSQNTHVITLTVTDKNSVIATDTKIINVVDSVVANINLPISLSFLWTQGSIIWFAGEVNGGTAPYTYEWSSDKDGIICNSVSCSSNSLSIGDHIITFSATDSSPTPLTDSDSVIIYVKAPEPLNVSIIAPLNNKTYSQGDNITFQGWVSGGIPYTTITMPPYYCEWRSDIDGLLSNDSHACWNYYIKNNALSGGKHTITLTATDSKGNTLSDSIKLNIIAQLGALKPIYLISIITAIVILSLIVLFRIIRALIKKRKTQLNSFQTTNPANFTKQPTNSTNQVSPT